MVTRTARTSRRFGAIDVGSNALRLRVIEVERSAPSHTHWRNVAEQRVPLRLGRGAFGHGRLGSEAIDAACVALRDFCREMHAVDVDDYRAVATSAVREATDGPVLVARAERVCAVRLEIIDGQEEARLVALAVRQHLPSASGRMVLIDLGGGSAEISLMELGKVSRSWSLPLGTVRLLAMIGAPPEAGLNSLDRTRLMEYIERILVPVFARIPSGEAPLIATGGNARALAQLCSSCSSEGLGHPTIDLEAMQDMFHTLAPLPPATRAAACSLRPDRADVIVPAAAVLIRVAHGLGAKTIAAPEAGLKEGVLESLVARWLEQPSASAVWHSAHATEEREDWRQVC